jgi:uncharacterized protein YbgA (DUF1722 family)/uncharacterized protein YbbK (DUF523 family)
MPPEPLPAIKLGISACLLGEPVRYDAGHKLDRYLRDTLGAYVQWVGVCPEVECGLGTPRESMRLEQHERGVRLVTHRSKTDHTERMRAWAKNRLNQLAAEDLCGFVFKSKSPSSGMERVKIFRPAGGSAIASGSGLFAGMFMERFALVPVEDEGRLHDPNLRENFIERVFAFARWKEARGRGMSARTLLDFHTRHKLLLMAHGPEQLRQLGKLVASLTSHKHAKGPFDEYLAPFLAALRLRATPRKHTNVLYHIMGYFKQQLTADEKQELIDIIEQYHHGYAPLIVPITLLNHYVRKYDQQYLRAQHYLDPHPAELLLRNHV